MDEGFFPCDDVAQYVAACVDQGRAAGRIPVLRREAMGRDELDWAQQCDRILRAHDAPSPARASQCTVVAVAGHPASVCAALLAVRSGRPLRLVADLHEAVAAPTEPGTSQVLVTALEDADDALLFGILDETTRALATDQPWDEIPRHTLVTGRDLAALSWMVGKLVAAAGRSPASRVRLRDHAPSDGFSEVSELELRPPSDPRIGQERLRQAELLAAYRDRVDVMAFRTHGSEACAKGGDGTVLCGLHRGDATFEPDAEGVLACGRGLPCPRGPHPVPLRHMATDVLMVATCNGLRLADSRTRPEFNFGLSFIDGDGVAYVSSAFSSSGGSVASVAFLAAMAAGCTVGEATMLINGLLFHGRLDRTAYVAIGDPEHRSSAQRARPRPRVERLPAHVELGDHHLAELVITDPEALAAAHDDALSLMITSEHGSAVVGYHRVQRDSDGQPVLVALLTAFPGALGRIGVVAVDPREAQARAGATLAAVETWTELSRTLGLEDADPEAYEELRVLGHELRMGMGRSLAVLSVDGGGLAHLGRQLVLGEELVSTASTRLMEHLVPGLQGSFWLPNVQAEEHAFERSDPAPCPTCARPALRRTMRHAVRGALRAVVVCPLCGVGSDLGHGSAIAEVHLETPSLVMAGEELRLTVVVRLAARTTLSVYPRLSTHDEDVPPPTPAAAVTHVEASGEVRLEFSFRLPPRLSPHRHYVKALLACTDGLAFASRPLFVGVRGSVGGEV